MVKTTTSRQKNFLLGRQLQGRNQALLGSHSPLPIQPRPLFQPNKPPTHLLTTTPPPFQKTVKLNPPWSKAYSRLGAAFLGLRNYTNSISANKKGLDIDPNNEALKSGLANAESQAASAARLISGAGAPPSPFGDAFSGAEMWVKLTVDPSTRAYMQLPDFVQMMKDIQTNPNNLNLYLKDQRVMQSLGVLMNFNFRTKPSDQDAGIPDDEDSKALCCVSEGGGARQEASSNCVTSYNLQFEYGFRIDGYGFRIDGIHFLIVILVDIQGCLGQES